MMKYKPIKCCKKYAKLINNNSGYMRDDTFCFQCSKCKKIITVSFYELEESE